MFTRKHRIYVAAVACALSVFAGSAAEAGRKPGAASGSGAIAATAAPRSTTLAAGKLGGVDGMHIPMSSFAAESVLAAGKLGGASGMDISMSELPDELVLAGGAAGGVVESWKF